MKKKEYDIAIIGESMSGKSTWIASMFCEQIQHELRKIAEHNKEGQTKLPTRYLLKNTGSESNTVKIEHIQWNEDVFHELEEKEDYGCLKKSLEYFTASVMEEDDTVKNTLEYLKGGGFEKRLGSLDFQDFYQNVINNREVLDTNLISYIEISGRINDGIANFMAENGVECIKLRDTRGFWDESLEQMKKRIAAITKERSKSQYVISSLVQDAPDAVRALMDDRGIHGIDACVILAAGGSNALRVGPGRELYGNLLKHMVNTYPVFVMLRTDHMTEIMMDEPAESYTELCEKLLKKPTFNGMQDIRDLLEEYGLNKEHAGDGYMDYIRRDHYKELLLANLMKNPSEEYQEIYTRSSHGALQEMVSQLIGYYQKTDTAVAFFNHIGDGEKREKLIKAGYDREFMNEIRTYTLGYYNGWFRYVTQWLANKIAGEYFGGLVGPRGGLSTRNANGLGHVGDAAICLLEAAYQVREKIYYQLVEESGKLIGEYIQENTCPVSVEEMKHILHAEFRRRMDRDFERLSITGRMISRRRLEAAHGEVKGLLQITLSNGQTKCKCLPEMESYSEEELWQSSAKYDMSVVKETVWLVLQMSLL